MTEGALPRLVHPDKTQRHRSGRDLSQVRYGQAAGLSDEEKRAIADHLRPLPGLATRAKPGRRSRAAKPTARKPRSRMPVTPRRPRVNLKPPRARTSAKKLFHPVVDGRLTQYSAKHLDYVDAARRAGRDLTEQEAQVASRAAQAGPGEDLGAIRADDASINHVVAAGTGQNTLNTSIAQFAAAKRRAAEHGDDPGRLRQSIGAQAAAVGRMQMYSRAIAHENLTPEQRNAADHRDRPGLHRDLLGAADQGRNQSLQRLLAVLQGQRGTREAEYRTLLKTTFDSPGNLRVGDAGLNGMISTGFDAEADGDGGMAARSRRLLAAHRAARPDHDDQIFSTLNGEVMSSSRAQVNTRKRKRPDDGVQTPGSEDATEHRHKRARPSPVADPSSRPQ